VTGVQTCALPIWDKVHLFWGDERHVPPEHQDSNYRMVKETLLSQIPIPPEHIHRIRGEFSNASEAADHYERELQGHFHLQAGEKPRFDMVLLGMGPDGHTASLFPGTTAVSETTRLVTAPWVEKFGTYRITLTAPVLNEAANVVFLVCGKDKAETLRLVLESENQIDNYPAQLIRPVQGHLLWLVDQAAASALTKHH
jgi:6-phosphogluconolactonase